MEIPEMRTNPARQMFVNFNLSRWIILILFLFITGGFFYRQYEMMLASRLDHLEDNVLELAIDMDAAIVYTANQIIQMEYWAEYSTQLADDDESVPLQLLSELRYHDSEGFYCFRQPQTLPQSELTGNFFGLNKLDLEDHALLHEVNMAIDLFSLQRSSLAANHDFVWSQYLSLREFSTIYPWTPGAIILQQASDLRMKTVFDSLYRDFSELLESPQEDIMKRWEAAAPDIRGSEQSLRYSTVVRNGDDALGIITVGIRPDFLQHVIKDCPMRDSQILLVNSSHQVLAACDESLLTEGGSEILLLDEVLPSGLQNVDFTALPEQVFTDIGPYRVYTIALTQAPWHLLFYYRRARMIMELLPTLSSGLAVMMIVIIILYLVTVMLQRNFITPSIALVDFIQAELVQDSVPLPKHLSPIWKMLFLNISDTFALKAVTGNIPGAVYRLARSERGEYILRFLSGGVRDFLEFEPDELLGEKNQFIVCLAEEERAQINEVIEASAKSMQPFHHECRLVTRSGEEKWGRFISRPRLGENGFIVWDGLILDITDRKELENDLAHLAATDVLTNINNRREYMSMTEREFSRFVRKGSSFCVLLFDIDGFKIVNDTYGHPAGDQVLVDIADILCASIREEDIEGRVGGEEFAVTLVGSDLQHAMNVAERIRFSIEKHVTRTQAGDIRVTISVGVTQVNTHDRSLSMLLSRADKALYDAKKTGKNCVIGV